MTIRILLADAHASMRESLRALVERQPEMEVVAEAENGQTMLQLSGNSRPDVVVMDTNMADLNVLDAARQMITGSPKIRILALSMHNSRHYADEMFKAGALGYLLKDRAFEELIRAIQTVADNRIYLCLGIEDSAESESD